MSSLLEIKNGTKVIRNSLDEDRTILKNVHLSVREGEFVTVLGGNGAGKSTLFNGIAGSLSLTNGKIILDGEDITHKSEENRAKMIARVFQDPKMGTAPRMTVAENLLLALGRGKKRRLSMRKMKQNQKQFQEVCALIGNGLEKHLNSPTGALSGGQRQSLSLLMATLKEPKLLLLDEHTAALDPKTSKNLMELTSQQIQEKNLTCLMITHRMEDALKYGDRLIVMEKGQIKCDLSAEEKSTLSLKDLLELFEETEGLSV
jgi:putative ABC transport system ATP-binding protein